MLDISQDYNKPENIHPFSSVLEILFRLSVARIRAEKVSYIFDHRHFFDTDKP
jgi:hypothetical protein